MKNLIRKWLGINDDVQHIAADMHTLLDMVEANSLHIFEIFHAMPYAAIVATMGAREAAALTKPNEIEANSLPAILMGILLNVCQGRSVMEVTGELKDPVRKVLQDRGFKIEETEGTEGKVIHILWT